MIPQPPPRADRFLEWYCQDEFLEDLQGDLYEIYELKYRERGKRKANLYYWWLVIRSMRYSVIKRSNKNSVNMTTNHLKIAWRLMLRHKLNSFLNILGLVLGITCFILLGLYVQRELTFDRFHERSSDIYRVWLKEDYGEGQVFFNTSTPFIFNEFLTDNFSQFEHVIQYDTRNMQVDYNDLRFNEQITMLGPGFFSVFDFPFVTNNQSDPLFSPSNIVLSESYAAKYFGSGEALGKTLLLDMDGEQRPFVVAAVLEDLPENTGFQLDMAISMMNKRDIYGESALEAWFTVIPETYVLVRQNEDITSVEESIQNTVMKVLGDRVGQGEYNIGFQPLTDIHLNQDIPRGLMPVGNKAEVYILAAIAILVLTIACLNFITMSLAQSTNRFMEVGIRKVMGAFQPSLIRQHLTESMLTVGIAALIGVLAAWLLMPLFNLLTDAGVSYTFEWWHILVLVALILILGVLSGFYPGMVLARWRTTDVFRGKAKTGRNLFFRKGIVVLQFMITAFLISSTLIMNEQLTYVQTSDLGIDYTATIEARLPPDPTARNLVQLFNNTMEGSNVVVDKLNSIPEISDVGIGSHAFGGGGWTTIGFRDNKDQYREARLLIVNPGYFETFSIEMAEGRPFIEDNPADAAQGLIINETAATYFGLQDPVNKEIPNDDFDDHRIIGVVKDFHFSSMHDRIEPLIIVENPQIVTEGISDIMYGEFPAPKLVFKYDGKPLSRVGDELENIWKEVFPDQELSFSIIEENMRYQYAREKRLQQMMLAATVLSIVIACMGLLGLTILMVNAKLKEISIRKVVGASWTDIFRSLTGNIVIQLSVGFVLSVPVVYWLMSRWLADFAYRIDISFWQFLVSAVLAIGIAIAVISYHTLRASSHNPVNSLRSE